MCQQSWSQGLLLCRTRHSSIAVAIATASTHFTYPQRDGSGWVDLGLVPCHGGLPVLKRSPIQALSRVTTLIESNTSTLSHTDTLGILYDLLSGDTSVTWMTVNPDFKGSPLFGVECLRNVTRYRHSYNGPLIGTYTCATQQWNFTLSLISKISSDTE